MCVLKICCTDQQVDLIFSVHQGNRLITDKTNSSLMKIMKAALDVASRILQHCFTVISRDVCKSVNLSKLGQLIYPNLSEKCLSVMPSASYASSY